MRALLVVGSLAALGVQAEAAPTADLVVLWAPGQDRAPVDAAARDVGAALIDRTPAREAPVLIAPLVKAGIDAYNALELDTAWAQLERALDAADRSGAAGLEPAQLSDLFLYRALVRIQRDDQAGAWHELVTAIVVDPARVLDPARFPPKVIELVGRARTEVLARPRATLAIEAPAGCTLALDGRTFDAVVPQLAGDHWVRVECVDFTSWGARATLAGDTRIKAGVAALTPPVDDDVLIQARTANARAVIIAEVRRGIGTVRLVGVDGREQARRTVSIGKGLAPLADAVRALGNPTLPKKKRWYDSRWVWAGGAAVLAAAVLIPVTAVLAADGGVDSATIGGPSP